MGNKKQVSDSRYESIMGMLTKLAAQKEQQQPATLHAAASSSGITHVPPPIHMSTTHVTSILTHANSPHGFLFLPMPIPLYT